MRQSRFFVPFDLDINQQYVMPDDISHYMSRVLRLPVGATVTLFNGDNNEYVANISEISKKKVAVQVCSLHQEDRESPLRVHLIQAVSKGDKMDWVIQKSVELGVSQIIPVTTSRTSFSLDQQRMEKKLRHWQGIIQSASEQCGRNQLAELSPISTIRDVISRYKNDSSLKLALNPLGEKKLTELKPVSNRVVILIGPEGGLSDEEIHFAEQNGFESCVLGKRILRTESAAISMVALVQGLWGDLLS